MINIKTIWDSQQSTNEIITKTRINAIKFLSCYIATNNITKQHLYIMSVSKDMNVPELKNYKFKGVEIFVIEADSFQELHILLLDNELKDIFTLFIQNILEELINVEKEDLAITKTLNVISKWKKLFEKFSFNGLTLEQQKGLFGELYYLKYLLSNESTVHHALNFWTGTEPGFESKDFTLDSIGVEIKFTTAKHPIIKITNERQLNKDYLDDLFLVLLTANSVKNNGVSLRSMVSSIRKMLVIEDKLELFNQKLKLYGYLDEHTDYYTNMYIIKNTITYQINNGFPLIKENQLPLGIHDVSYSIETSAVKEFIVDQSLIITKWKEL